MIARPTLPARLAQAGTDRRRSPVTRLLGCVVPLAGFTAALVVLTLCMLELTSQGGFCAKGGAYMIAHECSDRTALLVPASIWVMLLCVGLSMLSGGFGTRLAFLFWSAIFCTLGGAFVYSARFPAFSGPVAYGVGAMFILMGGLPLLGLLRAMPLTLLGGSRTITGEKIEPRPTASQFLAGLVPSAAGVGGGWWAGLELLAAF